MGSRQSERASCRLDKLAVLRSHVLFREFPPAVIDQLGSYMTRQIVPRGKTVFSKGDPGTGMMAVLSGSVKIRLMSGDGREVVLNIFRAGEVFGEIALLDGQARTADAIAICESELMVIERRDLIPFLRAHPDVALKFIEILCARVRRTSEQIEDVMFLDLPAKLAKTLLQLSVSPTSPAATTSASKAKRKVSITQREIGQIIGMSRESTNKQLRIWAERQWVRLERGGVAVLNQDALAEVVEKGHHYGF